VAENESLSIDGSIASRCTLLRNQIASEVCPSKRLAKIEDQFYLILRRACRKMANKGVSLESLLGTAFENPESLENLVQQTHYQDIAKILLDVVRSQGFLSFEQLVAEWLSAVWDSVRDELRLDLINHICDNSFNTQIQKMLNRLTRLIARNPSRIPPKPRRSNDRSRSVLDDTLGTSIL
jgi:hypothetical protein